MFLLHSIPFKHATHFLACITLDFISLSSVPLVSKITPKYLYLPVNPSTYNSEVVKVRKLLGNASILGFYQNMSVNAGSQNMKLNNLLLVTTQNWLRQIECCWTYSKSPCQPFKSLTKQHNNGLVQGSRLQPWWRGGHLFYQDKYLPSCSIIITLQFNNRS